jgi:tetratricopeptide (TPR) repeat protein
MSRFVNLEFNHESEDEIRESSPVKDERYYYGDAQRAFERGDFEQALRRYAKVLEFNPDNASAWTGQVRALIELNEFREGKLWADKALERFPHEPELLAAKAVALGRCGDVDAALAFSDASIEERGDTPYIWLARADVLLARREKRADYCFEKALVLAPRNWVVAWLAARIRFYYRQFALALKWARQALEWNDTEAMVWVQLGLCQERLGLIGPARTSWQQARQLNPQCAQAEEGLNRLRQSGWGARLRGAWLRVFQR